MRSRPFFALIAAAIVLRLLVLVALGHLLFPLNTDAAAYQQLADNFAAQRGLIVSYDWGTFRALYAPLYPILLAFLQPFLNLLTDLGIAYTLYRLGEAIGSRRIGRLAAVLFLFWPVAILFTPVPQKDTLAILLVAQVALAGIRLRAKFSPAETLRLGLAAGLIGLTQPAFVTFPAFVVLLLRRDLRLIGGSVAAAVVVMLPWWVRNWLTFHTFVPLTTASGYNLLVSVTGYYAPLKQFANMGEIEGSKAAFRAALAYVGEHPAQVLLHRIGSSVRAVVGEEYVLAVYQELPENPVQPFAAVLQGYWLALLAASALIWRRLPRELVLLFLACALQVALVNFWFEFGERHRYLIMPFVFLAAATGIGAAVEGWRERNAWRSQSG